MKWKENPLKALTLTKLTLKKKEGYSDINAASTAASCVNGGRLAVDSAERHYRQLIKHVRVYMYKYVTTPFMHIHVNDIHIV